MKGQKSSHSRKRYDSAFKRESVNLCDTSGKKVADPLDAFPGTGHQEPLEEENRQLRRELDIMREERDILKKAVAIFSVEPKAGSGS